MRANRLKLSERSKILLLSLLVGLGSGFAAVLLLKSISFIQSFIFPIVNKGGFSWAALVFPALGMLISLLLTLYLIKDNISHGVTKVLLAVSKKESRSYCIKAKTEFIPNRESFPKIDGGVENGVFAVAEIV
jgi:H+/Cl- antiporter ClcA